MGMRPRVALILPTLGGGGAEKIFETLSNWLSLRDWEVHLILLCKSRPPIKESPHLRVWKVDSGRVLWASRKMSAILREIRPAIMLSTHAHVSLLLLAMKAIGWLKIPLCLREPNFPSLNLGNERLPFLYSYLMRRLYPRAEGVISLNTSSAKDLRENFGVAEVEVIPNPVFRTEVPKENPFDSKGKGPHLLMVGRLHFSKRPELGLEALKRWSDDYPELTLTFLGQGPELANLMRKAQSLGMGDRVYFDGHQIDPTPWFRHADLFLLASIHEGGPNVLMEALYEACPVQVLRAPGVAEEMLHRLGLGERWVDSFESPLWRDGKEVHAKQLVEEGYGSDETFMEYENFLKKLMGDHPPRILNMITTLDMGGAEKSCLKAIERERGDHHLVVLKGGLGLVGEESFKGVSLHHLNLDTVTSLLLAPFHIWRILRSTKPTLLVGWMYHGALFSVLARWMGCLSPRLWMVRNTGLDASYTQSSTRWLVKFLSWVSRGNSLTLFNSHASRSSHEGMGWGGKLGVQHNTFDTERFVPLPKELAIERKNGLGLSNDILIVGWVSRRHPQKGPEQFLEFAKKLKGCFSKVHFLTIGHGLSKDDPEWHRLLETSSLLDDVTGFEKIDDLENWYPMMDVMVLTSVDESFPNVLGEAQACGVNCVSFDVGDASTLISKKENIIPRGDFVAMANRVRSLLEMSEEERWSLSQEARKRIETNFSDKLAPKFTY